MLGAGAQMANRDGETSMSRVMRDERTIAVELASYRWAYLLTSYALLGSVMYRSFVRGEASWDLLAIILAGGAVSSLYQGSYRVITGRWLVLTLLVTAMGLLVGALMLLLLR